MLKEKICFISYYASISATDVVCDLKPMSIKKAHKKLIKGAYTLLVRDHPDLECIVFECAQNLLSTRRYFRTRVKTFLNLTPNVIMDNYIELEIRCDDFVKQESDMALVYIPLKNDEKGFIGREEIGQIVEAIYNRIYSGTNPDEDYSRYIADAFERCSERIPERVELERMRGA